jgi:hypothetical protein
MNDLAMNSGVSGITNEHLARNDLSMEDFKRLSDLYDGEIRCVDHYILRSAL